MCILHVDCHQFDKTAKYVARCQWLKISDVNIEAHSCSFYSQTRVSMFITFMFMSIDRFNVAIID